MLVRNVPTDVRGMGGMRRNGNSIFVFEAAGLCIGHLGHLHHIPTPEQFAMLGRLDVVMVPVDGSYTLPTADAVATLRRLRSSVVLPMHWVSEGRLERFLSDMAEAGFEIDRSGGAEITLGLQDLPPRPTVRVLRPQFLN
jgi:L-ascorbate metabolism protein UlaG (beta-lactamase superfamily)